MTTKERDLKEIRKIRKILRQIEHLQLLNRELNDEEKLKVSRRAFLRQSLFDLHSKYADELLDTSDDITLNSTDTNLNQSSFIEQIDNLKNSTLEPAIDTKHIEQVTEKFTKLTLKEDQKESVVYETKVQKQTTVEANAVDIVQTKVTKTEKQKIETTEKKPKRVEPSTTYTSNTVKDAHDDLISSLDICVDAALVVTGSRDTTIRLWNYEKNKMLYSFGGHTSPITCVRFWSKEKCKSSMQHQVNTLNKDEQDYDDAHELLEKLNEATTEYPLVISSSLDCTFRIWLITKDSYSCLKQFYLYNKINWFSIDDDSFVFALDSGKIEYWKRVVKQVNLKAFDDSECVNSIQISQNKIYALTHNGSFKIYAITENQTELLKLINKNDPSTLPKVAGSQYYKSFVALDDERILFINNQSYIILQNIIKNKCELLSGASYTHDFTTFIYKFDDLVYLASYNIDKGSPSIHVFSSDNENVKYKYTLEDLDLHESISAICIKQLFNDTFILASASRRNLTFWNISKDTRYKSRVKQVKLYKIGENLHKNEEQKDSLEEEDDENDDNKTDESESSDEEQQPKKYCLIQ